MGQKLLNSTILITGASAGIGRASALVLAEEGANLVLTARRIERLHELEREIIQRGGKAVSVEEDAREEETAKRAVQAALDTFGQLDILINSTGGGRQWSDKWTFSRPHLALRLRHEMPSG